MIPSNDDTIEAFLPGARAAITLDDATPPATVILNRLVLEGHVTAHEWSILTRALRDGQRPSLWARIQSRLTSN